jgi:hypothetical protein
VYPVDPRVQQARRAAAHRLATPRRSWAARTSTVHLASFAHVIFLVGVPGASANRAAASAHARASSHARGSNYQVLFKLVSSKATARAYAFNSSAMGNQHAGASAHTAPTGYQTAKLLAAKCMRASDAPTASCGSKLWPRPRWCAPAGYASDRVKLRLLVPAARPPVPRSSGCTARSPLASARNPGRLRRLAVANAPASRHPASPPSPTASHLCLVRLRLAISSGCCAPAPV